MKRIFLFGAVVSFVVGYFLAVKGVQDNFAKADRSQTETGRYICWNKKNFEKKPGQQISTMAVSLMTALDAEEVTPLEGINGYSFKTKGEVEAKFKAMDYNDEWVIQKEFVHHVFLGGTPVATKCYQSAGPLIEVACPGATPAPTPSPSPEPSPVPTPNPVEEDRSWGRTRVHAKEAQALVDTSNVKVCIVDTGIDLQHPNKGNVIGTQDFTGKGSAQDGAGHGTHTAGTVGGTSGVGVSRAKLLICKGLSDNGSGGSSSLAQCLNWCGQHGAQVVSNSWGSPQSDPLINQTIKNLTDRGVYVFVAAGNDSGPVNWPAKLAGSSPLVYAVAASTKNDQIASFSSRGPEIRFISPGDEITSNWPGGGTKSLSGTSMATPHAASICAFGIAKGIKPCIKTNGTISGYPFADALTTAQ